MIRGLLFLSLAGALLAQPKLTPVDQPGYGKLVAAHKGKVVLVEFWATWCEPCRAEMPELVKLEQKLRARGFDLVTISTDEPEAQPAAIKVLAANHVAGPTYIRKAADDDKFCDAIDPKWQGVLPALFLYDRNGRKVRSFLGGTPSSVIEAAIDKVL
ncbi:MAG TPA: TlpA disulfide reductase family protein [Bryobacteraceae bacterium]|nr:TlpA disulfide reductase family protein [Bryobacteraceae bacterium]